MFRTTLYSHSTYFIAVMPYVTIITANLISKLHAHLVLAITMSVTTVIFCG